MDAAWCAYADEDER
jgi:hypothetical protein